VDKNSEVLLLRPVLFLNNCYSLTRHFRPYTASFIHFITVKRFYATFFINQKLKSKFAFKE